MNIEEINLNNIYEKLYKIPKEKLAEVNDFIEFILKQRSKAEKRRNHQNREKILEFAGIWEEMREDKFEDFMEEIRDRRKKFFSRRPNETRPD